MGDRIGLIAGSGNVPRLALNQAKARGLSCVVAAVRGQASSELASLADVFRWVDPVDLAGLVDFLKAHDVRRVLWVGKIDPQFSLRAESLLGDRASPGAAFRDKTPTSLIRALIAHLETQGLSVADPTDFLKPYFCAAGVLGSVPPPPAVLADIEFGWPKARCLADEDIGQTLAVKDRAVVAVEGLEGTDETIRRAGRLAGRGIVVIKLARTHQDMRVDVPAVGAETMRSLIRIGAAALCLEAERMPFFDRPEALALADANGIAVLAQAG